MRGQAIKVETSGSRFMRVLVDPSLSSSTSTSTGPVVGDSWEPLSSRSFGLPISIRNPSDPDEVLSHSVLTVENEHFKWTKYLSDLAARGRLSRLVTEAALELWKFLLEHVPTTKVPHAGPTEEGGLLMVWDRDRHHFEIEVSPSGRYDWFYRDRQSDHYWGEEDCTVGGYSERLQSTLDLVWPETRSTQYSILTAVFGGQR